MRLAAAAGPFIGLHSTQNGTFEDIPLPIQGRRLPVTLSPEQVVLFVNCVNCGKHQVILLLRGRRPQDGGRQPHHTSCGLQHSQRCRKRIEKIFGWIKTSAGVATVMLRGIHIERLPPSRWLGSLQARPAAESFGFVMTIRPLSHHRDPGLRHDGGGRLHLLFNEVAGELAFDCLAGSIHGSCDGDSVQLRCEETTKWAQPGVTAGPHCRMMASLR